MYPAEASNPSGGHCCQTYWGLFLRQPEGGGRGGGGERGDGGRWSGGWFEGGVGLGKGGGGGWLALLICKTANLRTLCLPALSSSFSTFSTTAFSSYDGPTRSFSLLPSSHSLSLALSLSTHFGSACLPPSRASQPLQTRTPIHIITLSLSPFSSVSLAYVPSSLRYVP